MSKNKPSKVTAFLNEPAGLEETSVSRKRKVTVQDSVEVELLPRNINAKSKKASFDTLSEAVVTEVSKKLLDDLTALQEKVVRQEQEINKLKKRNGILERKNSSLKKETEKSKTKLTTLSHWLLSYDTAKSITWEVVGNLLENTTSAQFMFSEKWDI